MKNVAFTIFAVVALLASVAGATAACDKKAEPAPRSGTIPITADDKGFTPNNVVLKKGEKSTLVFTRTSDKTCADKVVFPEINVSKDLPMNTPVSIDVPTEAPRTLTFQCGMGMFKSSVIVK
jgi:plastocyanin domain-containing protein